ncbi:unnamed protein product [Diabrotica balteata]|uniref:Uncharacterized protein n=1 Tax=Diabrotica balteata TaxID=107213 RepID=A0A9N9XEP0_DIABA|nr:unnamed protein product [Diabrotica balteata]
MAIALTILISVLVILGIIKIYNILKAKSCSSKVSLVGKVTIVTGANTGIGFETALNFATRGAKVILACRDLEKAEEAKDRIISKTENKNVVVKSLNLGSLQSVRDFAKDINQNEERLDILVNNAGSGGLNHKYTEDGLELLMQINYFAPVLLTILLTGLLKKSAPSRVINVSSIMAKNTNLTPANINDPPPGPYISYGNTKLANILFTIKLAEILKNSNVTVYSLHPGAVQTDIFRRIKGFKRLIFMPVYRIFFKTAEQGAQTSLYTALEQGLEKYSGCHFEECKRVERYPVANNPALVDGVWEKTVELLKCQKEVSELK